MTCKPPAEKEKPWLWPWQQAEDSPVKCCVCPSEEADIYCVEEDRNYCEWASQLAHYPGTATERYSLERIVKDKDTTNVRIFTRLAEEILFLTLLYIIIPHTFIHDDYLFNGTICPVGNQVGWLIAHCDAGLFYLAKGGLSSYCGLEDSYWRLWTDFWVRDVVTSTDTLGILLPTAVRAWVFYQVLCASILPVFSTFYAVAFMIAATIESFIPKVEPFITIEKVVSKIDFLPFPDQMPPQTLPRDRPSQDFVEAFCYWKDRYLRRFRGFYNTFYAAFLAIIGTPVWYLGPLRIICMLVPSIGPVIQGILTLLGFGPWMDGHVARFANSPMLDAKITDTVLENAFSSAYEVLTSGIFANQILAPLLNLLKVVLGESVHFYAFLLPIAMCGIAWFVIGNIRDKQQAYFEEKWEHELRDKYLGGFVYTSSGEPVGKQATNE